MCTEGLVAGRGAGQPPVPRPPLLALLPLSGREPGCQAPTDTEGAARASGCCTGQAKLIEGSIPWPQGEHPWGNVPLSLGQSIPRTGDSTSLGQSIPWSWAEHP